MKYFIREKSEDFLYVQLCPFFFGGDGKAIKEPDCSKLSIVIPALNEEVFLKRCIYSILSQDIATEIVVVDGGSDDSTKKVAESFKEVRLIESAPGRGIQIAKGVECAGGDTIIVLHADCVLKSGVLQRICTALEQNPQAEGGACGMTYETKDFIVNTAVMIHNFKTRFTGIAFGDQAQFFRAGALQDGFPRLALMEDVELSLMLMKKGKCLFIRDGVVASMRQWQESGRIVYG
ncbi:MAG: glycosyltransferase, partial [Chitinivibrionales bacterium]|nr:glycosyltransferase [Chitinivibrionales bacterium]MBD3359077.1 glycosyltransferase [Chitinivibrionales bacterium]